MTRCQASTRARTRCQHVVAVRSTTLCKGHLNEQLQAGREPIRPTTSPRRARRYRGKALPRGALTEAILVFLDTRGRQAVHADAILAHLQASGSAPVGRNPKASLGNALTRLEKQARVRNIGRNRWRRLRT